MWEIIAEAAKHRTVVLCSHSMEEVDTLADTIAIVREGSMMCLGSPVRLKTRFGSGYRIVCDITGDETARDLASMIATVSPSATLFPPTDTQCEFLVATDDDIVQILRIFEALCPTGNRLPNQAMLKSLGLPEEMPGLHTWSLKQTQLEDVFMAAANRDVRREARVGDDPIERCVATVRYLMEQYPDIRAQFRNSTESILAERGIEIPSALFDEPLGHKRMRAVTDKADEAEGTLQ
ncbi:ABC transporter A, ABCA [Kipferlia bialata]|uniref:ABC transporter A, ABCA n=1 Tax=Kipferlia bialata TaxID=797122 RepID=A0A9K3CQ64_9EUKA|nr:ABC transporter A, ABCA [Kipferlia bialata]|eukprot:g1062.t1